MQIFLAYFDQSRPNSSRFVKKHEKNFFKKFLGLGCCDKTATENDFRKWIPTVAVTLATSVFYDIV